MNKEEQKANILKNVKDLIKEIEIGEKDKKFALALFNNDLNKLLDFYISKEEIKSKIDNMIEKHPSKAGQFEMFESGKNQGLEDLLKELKL